jgi:PEP-CTERM motif
MKCLGAAVAGSLVVLCSLSSARAGIIAGSISETIVESRSGGQNVAWYTQAGTWANSTSKSTASGVTAGIGSTFSSNTFTGRSFTVAPDFGAGGLFEVFVTMAANMSTADQPISVVHSGGTANFNADLTSGTANAWKSLGVWTFGPGFSGSVTIATSGLGGNPLRGDAVLFAQFPNIPEPSTIFLAALGLVSAFVAGRGRNASHR